MNRLLIAVCLVLSSAACCTPIRGLMDEAYFRYVLGAEPPAALCDTDTDCVNRCLFELRPDEDPQVCYDSIEA